MDIVLWSRWYIVVKQIQLGLVRLLFYRCIDSLDWKTLSAWILHFSPIFFNNWIIRLGFGRLHKLNALIISFLLVVFLYNMTLSQMFKSVFFYRIEHKRECVLTNSFTAVICSQRRVWSRVLYYFDITVYKERGCPRWCGS